MIAMILCVTIGGVYAAWIYASPSQDIADVSATKAIGMSTAIETGAAGEYGINTNLLATGMASGISVEQAGVNTNGYDYHKPLIEYTVEGDEDAYIMFTLKLAENAPADIMTTLKSYYKISVIDVNSQYEGQDIFKDMVVPADDKGTESVWEYNREDDIYECKIYLKNEIDINDFILDTKVKHTNFFNALGGAMLKVEISDGQVPAGE